MEEGKRNPKGQRRITKGKKRRRVRLGSKREGAGSIGGGLTSCSKDNWFETLFGLKSEYFSPRMRVLSFQNGENNGSRENG